MKSPTRMINTTGNKGAAKKLKKFFLPNLNASVMPGFSSLANSSAAMRQTAPPARAITASFIRPKIMQYVMWCLKAHAMALIYSLTLAFMPGIFKSDSEINMP